MKDINTDEKKEAIDVESYDDSRLRVEEEFLLRVGPLSQDLNRAIEKINKSKNENKGK